MTNKKFFKTCCVFGGFNIFASCGNIDKFDLMQKSYEEKGYFLELKENSELQVDQSVARNIIPNALLIGRFNAGKTTVMNGICGCNLKASYSGNSNTRYIFNSTSKCKRFNLYDTPGLGAKEPFEDLVKIHAVASQVEINAIFVVINGQQDTDAIYKQFTQIVNPLCDGTIQIKGKSTNKKVDDILRKIIVIFNRCDGMFNSSDTEPEERIKNTLSYFQYEDFQYDYIFYGKPDPNTNPKIYDQCFSNLSDVMYNLMIKRTSNYLYVHLENFIHYYNNFINNSPPQKVIDSFKTEKTDTLVKEYEEKFLEISKGGSIKNKENLYSEYMIFFEKELSESSIDFIEKSSIASTIKTNNPIQHYYLQAKMFEEACELQKKLLTSLKYSVKHWFYDPLDIRNLIKRCKNCNTVWVKVEGCPSVKCGDRPSYHQDRLTEFGKNENHLLPKFQTYIVGRENGKLYHRPNKEIESLNSIAKESKFKDDGLKKMYYYHLIENQKIVGREYISLSKEEEEVFFKEGKSNHEMTINGSKIRVYVSQPVGCGNSLDWNKDTQFLEDDEIMEFLGVSTMEKAKDFFKLERQDVPKINEMKEYQFELENHKNNMKKKLEDQRNGVDKKAHSPSEENTLPKN